MSFLGPSFLFSIAPEDGQEPYIRFFNITHTLAIGIGCYLGSLLFLYTPQDYDSYFSVFLGSTVLRLLSLIRFPKRKVHIRGSIKQAVPVLASMRTLSFRLNTGPFKQLTSRFYKKLKNDKK